MKIWVRLQIASATDTLPGRFDVRAEKYEIRDGVVLWLQKLSQAGLILEICEEVQDYTEYEIENIF